MAWIKSEVCASLEQVDTILNHPSWPTIYSLALSTLGLSGGKEWIWVKIDKKKQKKESAKWVNTEEGKEKEKRSF